MVRISNFDKSQFSTKKVCPVFRYFVRYSGILSGIPKFVRYSGILSGIPRFVRYSAILSGIPKLDIWQDICLPKYLGRTPNIKNQHFFRYFLTFGVFEDLEKLPEVDDVDLSAVSTRLDG